MALNLAALIMSYQVSVSPFAILATQQLRAVLPKAQAEKSPKVGKKSQFFQNKIPIKILVAMLRRQKREISRENEEKSVKTDNFVQIEKFLSKNGRFRRLNIPPWPLKLSLRGYK